MREYLDILKRIEQHGAAKSPTRIEGGDIVETIGLPNQHFSTTRTFPILTTRRINFKAMAGELRSFLEGSQWNIDFVENGCNFWTPWENVLSERGKPTPAGCLGPIYGAQWNKHGQLDHVLHCLRERPTDRRMVVSAWRPDEHDMMALPPCHVMFIVTPYAGKLYLAWFQRSCDFPIGVPYNIASYGLLAHLFAKWAGMEYGEIDCIFCDAHIYVNQLHGVREWLQREPRELPRLALEQSGTDFFD